MKRVAIILLVTPAMLVGGAAAVIYCGFVAGFQIVTDFISAG